MVSVKVERVHYDANWQGVVFEATVDGQTRGCVVPLTDLDFPSPYDPAVAEFMRRIDEVRAATETAIARAAPGGGMVLVRL